MKKSIFVSLNKKTNNNKQIWHQRARQRAEMRKRSANYKKKRASHLLLRQIDIYQKKIVLKKEPVNIETPQNFSFIDNTQQTLSFINQCRTKLHRNENVHCDISNVKELSADAIALLVACTNDPEFRGKYTRFQGNEPKNNELKRLFRESGFYKFVCTSKLMKTSQKVNSNLLHKESHYNVQPDIAKEACLYGTKHVFGNCRPISELYEMLVEAMSNTNNHASYKNKSEIKWWLYTYNNPKGFTSYSFIDLGVGIFESIPVQAFKRFKKRIGISDNIDLVQDLLEGKIKSSIKNENAMRGKGIPQIATNSLNDTFKRAYIISNDVKIDLKTRVAEKLNVKFKGTFLYWELFNNQNQNNERNNSNPKRFF